MSNADLNIKSTADLLKAIADNNIEYLDFNFTDLRGKLQHTTQHVDTVDKDLIEDGVFFDGSSIAGWKAINESDMVLMPDVKRVTIDPFAAQPTLKIFCDVHDPITKGPYDRDPRSIAKAAEAYVEKSGIADTAFFGPEAEFFVFDDVKFAVRGNKVSYELDSIEDPNNTDREYADGNMGHRPRVKGGYFPEAPVDSGADLRAEMLSVMRTMGVPVEKHHHEVAASQHELGIKFSTLVDCADHMQIYNHV